MPTHHAACVARAPTAPTARAASAAPPPAVTRPCASAPQVRPSAEPLSAAAARSHGGLSGPGALSHLAGGDRDQLGGYKSAYDPVINTAQPGPPGGARGGTGRPEEAYT